MSDFGNYSSLLKYEELEQQINEFIQISQKDYIRNYKSLKWVAVFVSSEDSYACLAMYHRDIVLRFILFTVHLIL